MSRINKLFTRERENILSLYFCAGYPSKDNTVETLQILEQSGVKMVEIGIPFSDPMADGVVIQEAATRALEGGMTLRLLFSQLANVRESVSIPLVLMGYLNPIIHFGFENFCRECQRCGIDGVIIPDLPFAEYMEEYRAMAQSYGVEVIMLITPETEDERIRAIDAVSGGFIYMVSSASITGAQQSFEGEKERYFQRIASLGLRNPLMVGFGISNRQTFEMSCRYANGAIIGSRFVSLQTEYGDSAKAVAHLLNDLKRC